MLDLFESTLRCQRCAAETRHEMRYAGRLLVSSRCTACGFEVNTADLHRYMEDLIHRVVTKPRRMIRRLRRDPGTFIRTLPGATAAKPLKLAKELAAILQASERRGV